MGAYGGLNWSRTNTCSVSDCRAHRLRYQAIGAYGKICTYEPYGVRLQLTGFIYFPTYASKLKDTSKGERAWCLLRKEEINIYKLTILCVSLRT